MPDDNRTGGHILSGFNLTIGPSDLEVVSLPGLSQAEMDSPIMARDVAAAAVERADQGTIGHLGDQPRAWALP
jgi:hypothetical protein